MHIKLKLVINVTNQNVWVCKKRNGVIRTDLSCKNKESKLGGAVKGNRDKEIVIFLKTRGR